MRTSITTPGQRRFGIPTGQVAVDMFRTTVLVFTHFAFAALSTLRLELRAWYERAMYCLALPSAPAANGGPGTSPLDLSPGKAVPASRVCLIAG